MVDVCVFVMCVRTPLLIYACKGDKKKYRNTLIMKFRAVLDLTRHHKLPTNDINVLIRR